jgi:hypothetical protein
MTFTDLQKAPVNFVKSVLRVCQRGAHWTELGEICYRELFMKICPRNSEFG